MKKIVLGLLVISSVFVNAEDSSMKNGLTNGDKKDIYRSHLQIQSLKAANISL